MMEDDTQERIVVDIENESDNEVTHVDFFNANENRVKINITTENKTDSENKTIKLAWFNFVSNENPCEKEYLETLKFNFNIHGEDEEFSVKIDPLQDQKGVFLLGWYHQANKIPVTPSFVSNKIPSKSKVTIIFYCDPL